MGYLPGEIIKSGGDYLLSILKWEPQIEYCRFYDGTEETRKRLRERLGLSEEDADWYSVELIMDLAVSQVEEMEFVEVTELEELLADGEPNYRIELTPKGRDFIVKAESYTFPDIEP